MILDTLAIIAATENGKINHDVSVEKIFYKLVELQKKGVICFNYEILTFRGCKNVSSKMNEWKYYIKEILTNSLGIKQIEDSILNDIMIRIGLYQQGIMYPEDTHVDSNCQQIPMESSNNCKEVETPILLTLNSNGLHVNHENPLSLNEKNFETLIKFGSKCCDLNANHGTVFPLTLKSDIMDNRDFNFICDEKIKKPLKLDYTSEMTSVKNQGKLGSCVAFACAAMKEWQEIKEYQDKDIDDKNTYKFKEQFKDLSEQWIYYMAKRIDPWPKEEGTSLRYAMKVLKNIGVPNEKNWRYNELIKGSPENWAHLIARWNVIKSYERITDMNQLKYSLLSNGPLVAGLICFKSIFSPNNGIVNVPGNDDPILGGHAVCIVGYDDEKRQIKFKNSWGVEWGDRGYGYISYDYAPYLIDIWAGKDSLITFESFKKFNFSNP